jgi:hypothetical protein
VDRTALFRLVGVLLLVEHDGVMRTTRTATGGTRISGRTMPFPFGKIDLFLKAPMLQDSSTVCAENFTPFIDFG